MEERQQRWEEGKIILKEEGNEEGMVQIWEEGKVGSYILEEKEGLGEEKEGLAALEEEDLEAG